VSNGWVTNYISNDSKYSKASVIPNAFNISCNPARAIPTRCNGTRPPRRSNTKRRPHRFWLPRGDRQRKEYQLNTLTNKYHFIINSSEALAFLTNPPIPGRF